MSDECAGSVYAHFFLRKSHRRTEWSSEPLASILASARQKSTVQARLSCSSNSHTAARVSASHTVTTPS